MRVLILTPRQPPQTGNRITAERHRLGVERLGNQATIVETDPEGLPEEAVIAAIRSDIVHLLHAWRTGAPWLAAGLPLPFVVTLTGTDLHLAPEEAGRKPVIDQVLQQARGVITQNRLSFRRLAAERPDIAGRLHYLPPAIRLGNETWPLRQRLDIPPEAVLFLHPAGIRPVKKNLELLLALAPLAAEAPELRLVFCGPLLDKAYGERFLAALAGYPWARWAGAIRPEAMADVLRQADVVLNHSASEGLSNALLEAAALGRPILAREIAGNAAVVEPKSNGLLYADDEELLSQARILLDPAERRRLSRPQPGLADPHRESEALLAIYKSALEGQGR